MRSSILSLTALVALAGCATTSTPDPAAAAAEPAVAAPAAPAPAAADPFPSTYRPLAGEPTLITGAVVLTGTGERLDGASVLIVDGKIAGVGHDVAAPEGARVIDAAGRWVTPGLIDVHSHLGVYPSPGVDAHSDGNEMTSPVTAEVWAEHSVWPQDPGFVTALAGGVTALQVLPGSANLIGGRSVTLKNVPSRTVQGMKFPGAPYGLKMACGENPKRLYGNRGRSPMTRMGNMAGYRAAWIGAEEYRREQREWREEQADGGGEGDEGDEGEDRGRGRRNGPPRRDLAMETLAGVLDGQILVHNHCYRADEMAQMIDLAKEFGYEIAAFHHGVEAYKVADLLAENGICGALWADWWGFKMEAFDGVRENLGLVDAAAGGCAIVHSDSDQGIQRLNQEAAKAMAAAERAGLSVPRERAIRWITANAARALGIDDVTGSLEPGKNADVVLWNGDPFSVYARADRVWIDGGLAWDREDPAYQPQMDFTLGLLPDEPFSPGVATNGAARPSATAAPAAPAVAPAVLDGETVAITGATVYTAGPAGTLENATVLIADGRIAAVGADVAVPPGARVIDGRGKTVTPGLFDSLTRLGVVEVGAVAGSRDTATEDDRVTAAFRVTDAFNPESTLLAINRVDGLTRAVVAPSTGGSLIAGEAAVVHLGTGSEPVVAAPVAMTATLGERGARLAGGSRAAALLALREALADARDYAAHREAWERRARRDYALSRLDLEALVPVVEGRLPLVVAVDRASDVRAVLALGAEEGVRLVLAGVAEGWRVADEIAAAGVPVLLDPMENLPSSFEMLGATLENAARLHAAGVTVALASEDAHNARNLRQAAGNAVAHGLPRDAALAAMTSVPAAIWGLSDHVGTLAPGREADVVVWDGDPLELSSYPAAVFIRGRQMADDNRQLRLRDRYLALPAAGELPLAYPRP